MDRASDHLVSWVVQNLSGRKSERFLLALCAETGFARSRHSAEFAHFKKDFLSSECHGSDSPHLQLLDFSVLGERILSLIGLASVIVA